MRLIGEDGCSVEACPIFGYAQGLFEETGFPTVIKPVTVRGEARCYAAAYEIDGHLMAFARSENPVDRVSVAIAFLSVAENEAQQAIKNGEHQ